MIGFNQKYSDWYTAAQGGRTPKAVGDLRKLIEGLPDEMPVKVSHQYDRHPVGVQDPIIRTAPIVAPVGLNSHGGEILAPTGLTYLIVE